MLKNMFIFMALGVLCFSSCSVIEESMMSEDEYAEYIIDEIILSVNEQSPERLKALFSKTATESMNNFQEKSDNLFKFIASETVSHEYDGCVASDMSIEYGEKTNMFRFSFEITTADNKKYDFFIICYNIDTVNADNVGVYMLEVANSDYDEYVSWQERMTPGIVILESSKDE